MSFPGVILGLLVSLLAAVFDSSPWFVFVEETRLCVHMLRKKVNEMMRGDRHQGSGILQKF